VYRHAKPEIGLKIQNNSISLYYLVGNENNRTQEVATNFQFGEPITFGFDEQDKFTATQRNTTIQLR
jgi:hypothetical protein